MNLCPKGHDKDVVGTVSKGKNRRRCKACDSLKPKHKGPKAQPVVSPYHLKGPDNPTYRRFCSAGHDKLVVGVYGRKCRECSKAKATRWKKAHPEECKVHNRNSKRKLWWKYRAANRRWYLRYAQRERAKSRERYMKTDPEHRREVALKYREKVRAAGGTYAYFWQRQAKESL